MDRWTDGWMDGKMNGCMGGWRGEQRGECGNTWKKFVDLPQELPTLAVSL